VHEIKHDGYRLLVRRTPAGVWIATRRGFDRTDRYPLIVDAAKRLRATSFVLDGEGVILRQDGVSDFDRLRSRRHDNGATPRLRRHSRPRRGSANRTCHPASAMAGAPRPGRDTAQGRRPGGWWCRTPQGVHKTRERRFYPLDWRW